MIRVARVIHEGTIAWGVVREANLLPVDGAFDTTGALLTHGRSAIDRAAERAGSQGVPLASVTLLSPITSNQQIICLAKNYRAHTRETGVDPDSKTFNMWFRKASSCLAGPHDAIVRPSRVRLLDYEVELGLVIGREVNEPTRFKGPGLPDVVGALVIHNDVSARDVQVPQLQYYKGKSFRTFGPTGPWLTLVDHEIRSRWQDIRLQTRINGELRQDGLCADMVYRPHETLSELSEVQDLRPGDLIATGTPSGVAMQRPPAQEKELARLPKYEKWLRFIDLQEASGRFLKPGDRVQLTARTHDGAIDLGTLDNHVEAP